MWRNQQFLKATQYDLHRARHAADRAMAIAGGAEELTAYEITLRKFRLRARFRSAAQFSSPDTKKVAPKVIIQLLYAAR